MMLTWTNPKINPLKFPFVSLNKSSNKCSITFLVYTNILVGGILIFVDILKELPITLLLRPFNFETLATYVYQYASDEMLEESSLAAIIIILAGLGPIILLNSTIKKFSFKKDSFETTEVLTTGAHS